MYAKCRMHTNEPAGASRLDRSDRRHVADLIILQREVRERRQAAERADVADRVDVQDQVFEVDERR
jgi:hypothetical protein